MRDRAARRPRGDPRRSVGLGLVEILSWMRHWANAVYLPPLPGPRTRLPLSVTLTGVCNGLDLASTSITRNLNICQGTIGDAVGLFQNITNATLIILEND